MPEEVKITLRSQVTRKCCLPQSVCITCRHSSPLDEATGHRKDPHGALGEMVLDLS
jgi:hypothetical protein